MRGGHYAPALAAAVAGLLFLFVSLAAVFSAAGPAPGGGELRLFAPQNTAYTLSLDPTTLHEYDGRAYVTVTATAATAATADTTITITLGGTATKDTDYALDTNATLPTITVKSGAKTGAAGFYLTPTYDTSYSETDETIIVSGTATGATFTDATLNLKNVPLQYRLSVSPARLSEAADATTVRVMAARVSGKASSSDVTVTLNTDSSSTATSGTDYAAVTLPSITIAANKTVGEATFSLDPTADTAYTEGNETIKLTGSVTTGTFTSDDFATITITDGPFVGFDSLMDAHAVYPAAAVSIVADAASNATATANVSYSAAFAVEPSGRDHDLTFTAATRTISGTLNSAAVAGTKITATITATDNMGTTTGSNPTADDETATTKVAIIVVAQECGIYDGWADSLNTVPTLTDPIVRDCNVLLAARDTLEGDDGTLNWADDESIFNWDGITVTEDTTNRVTRLNLTSTHKSKLDEGTIPPLLGTLDKLDSLRIESMGADLTGAIPPELGSLSLPGDAGNDTYRGLYLNKNQLSGAIPPELGSIDQMRHLNLGENRLTGAIPKELGNLAKLERLYLERNCHPILGWPTYSCDRTNSSFKAGLSGAIPPELGNLTKLVEIKAEYNSLTGAIPPELGPRMSNLIKIELQRNKLSGAMPPSSATCPA